MPPTRRAQMKKGDICVLKVKLQGHMGEFLQGTRVLVTRADENSVEIIREVDKRKEYRALHFVMLSQEAEKYLIPAT